MVAMSKVKSQDEQEGSGAKYGLWPLIEEIILKCHVQIYFFQKKDGMKHQKAHDIQL